MSRKEAWKKELGISEYPWSSDDDDDDSSTRGSPRLLDPPPPRSRLNGTSDPTLASSSRKVPTSTHSQGPSRATTKSLSKRVGESNSSSINRPKSSTSAPVANGPSTSTSRKAPPPAGTSSSSAARKAQDKKDRDSFWSAINGPNRFAGMASLSRSRENSSRSTIHSAGPSRNTSTSLSRSSLPTPSTSLSRSLPTPHTSLSTSALPSSSRHTDLQKLIETRNMMLNRYLEATKKSTANLVSISRILLKAKRRSRTRNTSSTPRTEDRSRLYRAPGSGSAALPAPLASRAPPTPTVTLEHSDDAYAAELSRPAKVSMCDDYGPFDPMPMSEPLFTQPPDNNLDNRRDQDVNNLHLPDSQPLNDSQDYTCCDDNELESNNRRDQDVNNLHLPDSQSLNDSQDYTCCDDNELESISDNRRDQDVIMNDVDTNNLPDSQPLYDSQDYTCCDDNEPEPEKEETEDNLKKTQDTKSETENKVQNMEQNETSCVHCIFDKELDKRNYYFELRLPVFSFDESGGHIEAQGSRRDTSIAPAVALEEEIVEIETEAETSLGTEAETSAETVEACGSGSAQVTQPNGTNDGTLSAHGVKRKRDCDEDVESSVIKVLSQVTNHSNAVSEETSQSQGVKRKRDALPVGSTPESRQSTHPADDDEENSSLKDFNQNLLKLLECPVCLECMAPPLAQCRRGHLVCGKCRARLAACPVCRAAFSSVRNRAMEGVADMVWYPCRHGCGRSTRLRLRATHEASCAARRHRCPAPACAARALRRADLPAHAESKHMSIMKLGKTHDLSLQLTGEEKQNFLVYVYGEMFHLKLDVDVRTWGLMLYVTYMGPLNEACKYTYQVVVTGQYNSRKLVYNRQTHCDLESSALNTSRQDCFHMTLDQAINFLRVRNKPCEPNQTLNLTVEILQNESPRLDEVNISDIQ